MIRGPGLGPVKDIRLGCSAVGTNHPLVRLRIPVRTVAGENSVGYKIEVKHSAPTTIGMKVTLKAKTLESTERKAVFAVEAYNETGVQIGEGKHERRAIDMTRFAGPSTSA